MLRRDRAGEGGQPANGPFCLMLAPEYDATVRRQDLAGDPAAIGTKEPRNKRSHLVRGAGAADQGLARPLRHDVVGQAACQNSVSGTKPGAITFAVP